MSSNTSTSLASARPQADSVTPKEEIGKIFDRVKRAFDTRKTYDLEWRFEQLNQMEKLLQDNCDAIVEAIKIDLGRPPFEGLTADVVMLLSTVRHNAKHLKSWAKSQKVHHPLTLAPGSSEIRKEPRGVALIIGAWNFPFSVTFGPLIDAITAGCCCVIKPSEISGASAKLMSTLVKRYLDQDAYQVVLGGVPETTELLSLPFDHIFYTGNGSIAKIVMKAAAQNLASVTLELGGKSPVIVEKDANIAVAAKRIIVGKSVNCGQICLAPDYVLCNEEVLPQLVENMKKAIKEMHGNDVEQSKSYGRIINVLHWDRIANLIKTSKGDIVAGGLDVSKRENKFIPPTIIIKPDPSSPILREEIFGPVLIVFPVKNTEEALHHIKQQEIPLALYVFSNDKKKIDYILKHARSGGVCINDCLYHYSNPSLPFGGLGPSGQGKYHGVAGFNEFSHSRAVMTRPTYFDPASRYPPYAPDLTDKIKGLMVFPMFGKKTIFLFKTVKFLALIGLVAYAAEKTSAYSRIEKYFKH
eukprot:c3855_g1_i1.p1 GENE.c3855_g1_i1~~c3855_g1_i1.p1  ORF type:complete len:541 (+),score=242.56 c3855_g1_i1:47-1624(+)